MDNSKKKETCDKCGQSAWRMYGGKYKCIPCGHRPSTSYGMCAPSVYARNHPEEVNHDK